MKTLRIDKAGKVEELNLLRKDLLKEFELHSRDLRPILVSNQISTILVRDESIIINFERVKLIISNHQALLFQIQNKEISEEFIKTIKKKIKQEDEESTQAPFEFIIIDAALEHAATTLDYKYSRLSEDIEDTLKKLSEELTEENLELLLKLKNKMNNLETVAKEMQHVLLDILEDEEDMREMYLTQMAQNVPIDDTDEIESIIDSALEQIEDTVNQISETNQNIESTLEITTLKMNNLRNSIIKTDLMISLGTGVLTFGAVVVGLFGANLMNSFEKSSAAFWFLTIFVVISSIILFWILYMYFKKKKIL